MLRSRWLFLSGLLFLVSASPAVAEISDPVWRDPGLLQVPFFILWCLLLTLCIEYLAFRLIYRKVMRAFTSLVAVNLISMSFVGMFFLSGPDVMMLPTPAAIFSSFVVLPGDAVIQNPLLPVILSMILEPVLLLSLFQSHRFERVLIWVPLGNLIAVLIERILFMGVISLV